jgi:hypothetical protein
MHKILTGYAVAMGLGLMGTAALAQQVQLAPAVVTPAGGHGQVGRFRFSYTLGQPVIETRQVGSLTLTQGFQQPEYRTLVARETQPEPTAPAAVWPNPANGQVWLRLPSVPAGAVGLGLYDATGKLVHRWARDTDTPGTLQTQLDLPPLAAGLYSLRVAIPNAPLQSFRLMIE